jgi:hypothetical protein
VVGIETVGTGTAPNERTRPRQFAAAVGRHPVSRIQRLLRRFMKAEIRWRRISLRALSSVVM